MAAAIVREMNTAVVENFDQVCDLSVCTIVRSITAVADSMCASEDGEIVCLVASIITKCRVILNFHDHPIVANIGQLKNHHNFSESIGCAH